MRLAPDELFDVRMVGVEDDHLRRAPCLAAGLDRAGGRVGAAHERDWAGRVATLRELLLRRPKLREVDSRPRTRSEEHTLNSSHARISYAVFCLKKKKRTINPTYLLLKNKKKKKKKKN